MIVTLTDFGNSEYLGVMKGVIYSLCSNAQITDLCNTIPPQSVKEAAWSLLQNYRFFPKKSVFLCVVDPGVGSGRNAIAVQTQNFFFVGPDNGLMYPAAKRDLLRKIITLSAENSSKTFHGRDVFAKAAAEIELGKKPEQLGKVTHEIKKLEFYLNGRVGEIVRIDNFGNLITNIPPGLHKKEYHVQHLKFKSKLNFYETYSAAPQNELFLIKGSSDTLEISLKNRYASRKFRARVGERITIS